MVGPKLFSLLLIVSCSNVLASVLLKRRQAEDSGQDPTASLPSLPSTTPAGIVENTPGPLKCPPRPEIISELDLEKYTGTWYQVLGLPSFFQPDGTKCISATYDMKDNTSISIWNTNVRPDGKFGEICGSADLKDERQGELQVKFAFIPIGADMLILDTDYDNYAVVYSCVDFPIVGKFEYAWVLSREINPSEETINIGRNVLNRNGIEVERMKSILHDDECVYNKPDGEPSCSQKA